MRYDIAAVILAAGKSERLGTPKQLVEWQGKTLINRAIDLALDCALSPVIVVLGAYYPEIKKQIETKEQIKIINNHNWQNGQSTSLIAGVNAIRQLKQPVLILLCDQPCLTTAIVDGVIQEYERSSKVAAMVDTQGKKTPPVILSPKLFDTIQRLEGDMGAREILKYQDVAYYQNSDEKAILDIDTMEDYKKLLKCV